MLHKSGFVFFILIQVSCAQSWGKFWELHDSGSTAVYRLIADTGQTFCASGAIGESAMMSCNGLPISGQDGHFVNIPNARSFSGPTAFGGTTQRTTRDNLTGLTWKTCAEGYSDPGCTAGPASTSDWHNAPNFCAALNVANYGGINTWRLPSIEEFQTIMYYGGTAPFIETAYFTAADTGVYWASNTSAANSNNAWIASFNFGWADTQPKATASGRTRCVSGAGLKTAAYRDNNDGTVSDLSTRLRWQKCNAGFDALSCTGTVSNLTWQAALTYCQGLSLAARSWRLPNVNELANLVDYSMASPAINSTYFPNTELNLHWASTSDTGTTNAVNVSFSLGFMGSGVKSGTTMPIRCVATE